MTARSRISPPEITGVELAAIAKMARLTGVNSDETRLACFTLSRLPDKTRVDAATDIAMAKDVDVMAGIIGAWKGAPNCGEAFGKWAVILTSFYRQNPDDN